MLKRRPQIRDSSKVTIRTVQANKLQEKAAAVMKKDKFISKEILERFESFESSGESDDDDLKERFKLIKKNMQAGGQVATQDKDNQFCLNDMVVEIHNHVSAVMLKFTKCKKDMLAALRADINYQIAVKINKTSGDLADLQQVISTDMKRWASQRSDLQMDINKLKENFMIMKQEKSTNDPSRE